MPLIRLSAVLICLSVISGCASVASNAARLSPDSPPGSCGCGNNAVGDRVFFAFNKANLSHDAESTLRRQAGWLRLQAKWFQKYPRVKIIVAGNTDERGTETYNLALGWRRAEAARNELVALGAPPSRIQTISYGKDCPVGAGNDEAAYQQNRNAITSLLGWNPQHC